MSIIYGTLEKLELDEAPPASGQDGSRLPKPVEKTRHFPVRSLATALLFVMAVANLLLWYWSSQVSAPPSVATPAAGATQLAFPQPVEEPVLASVPEVPAIPLEPITTSHQHIVPRVFPTPVVKAEAGKAAVSSHTVNVETAPAEPVEPGKNPRTETAHQAGVDQMLENARLALSRGDYGHALFSLETLTPVPETRADFWFLKGSAHLAMGQLVPAEADLVSAQKLAPENAQIALQLAILKQERGDHAGALEILDSVGERNPHIPEIFLNKGYSQQSLGAVRDAKRSFREFLSLTEGRSLYSQQRQAIKEWLAREKSAQVTPL
jgi:hypothetical protein